MTTPTTDDTDRAIPPAPPPSARPAMYHGILGEIVHIADPTTEADPVGVLASLISACGVVIGPGAYVPIGNTMHPLLIWPLLFGRTGSGRKGEAGETASVFMRRAAATYFDISVTGLSSGEGLIERIRDPEPDNDKDKGGTVDKRLAVTEPEFASVMARAKREGSTLGYVLREAWTGKPLTVLNRRQLHATSSHVGIVGHITPKEFRLRMAEADMAGGTFNRFLPVYVERSKKLPIPEGVSPQTIEDLGSRLGKLLTAAKNIGPIGMDDGAAALWTRDLYDELTEADDEDAAWTEFARRAAPYTRRVAGLYAVLDGRTMANRGDLLAATALVRYSIDTARYVLDGRRRDPRQDRIVRALDGAGEDGLTLTKISALFSRNLPKRVLGEMLDDLVSTGQYELVKVPTGGRPAEVYRRTKKTKETE